MNELKKLNDLSVRYTHGEFQFDGCGDEDNQCGYDGGDKNGSNLCCCCETQKDFKEKIKSEAIKWINGDLALFEPGSTTWKWIVYFFNISEEELFNNTVRVDGGITNTPTV